MKEEPFDMPLGLKADVQKVEQIKMSDGLQPKSDGLHPSSGG